MMDPEMSASTGLTNDVCGRLSLFTRGPQPDETASALPTPSKVQLPSCPASAGACPPATAAGDAPAMLQCVALAFGGADAAGALTFRAAFVEQDLSDVNEEGYVEVDSPAAQADIFDVSEDELLRQKDAFLESIAVRRPPGEPPVALKLVRPSIYSANARKSTLLGPCLVPQQHHTPRLIASQRRRLALPRTILPLTTPPAPPPPGRA